MPDNSVDYRVLHSPGCTAIWECPPNEAPLWRYWGPRLPDDVLPGPGLRDTRREASFTLQFDQPLPVFPGLALGWFGQPALEAHRAGRDWTHAATACRVETAGEGVLRFHIEDATAGIAVAVTAALDPETDVLMLSARLTNTGEGDLHVQWLAAGGVPLPPDAERVEYYSGRHNIEFVAMEDRLGRALWRRENRRGLTSHDCFPGAIVACADGIAYGAQLAWSGNHAQQIDWLEDGRRNWQMGEWLAPGEVRLAPGESIETPEMLATCSAEGANGVSWAFHRAIRKRIPWPGGSMKPRPVHLNTWEAVYFRHDLGELRALADAAAEIGIERFVLDDGWFQGRNDDTSSLGDWRPDAAKYPDGLRPLAEHVTGLGMEFGLWIEPEMVNPDSDLFRAHPDWALQVAGRPLITGRNQLVLDLTRPEVSDYLFETLAPLIAGLPLGYLKWDHNRELTQAGETPRYREQVLALYALIDRFRAAFPEVEVEACAGGGGRIDAGIARHTHRFWTSDTTDAVSRVSIQRGFLRFMPPELMGAHVGANPCHTTGRTQSMAFRAGVAMPGHFGVELDLRKLQGAEREELGRQIAAYKELRSRLHYGRVWMGEAGDGVLWQAHGDEGDLLLFLVRTAPATLRHQPPVRLPMLDANRRYKVKDGEGMEADFNGAWLQRAGLPAPAMRAEEVRIIRIVAR